VIGLGQHDRLGDPSGAAAAPQGDPRGSVAILLCTFNGARFLPLQLASFEAQDFSDWRLFVSDDGSNDGTLALLEDFRRKHGADRVQLRHGPEKGAVANFMSLICDPALDSAFYALSDQDDVWAANKLSRACSFLTGAAADAPSLYCSRVRMIDENGAEIGLTPIHKNPPHFRNALVQNIAIGNTVAFNEKTRRLLVQAGADVNAAVHDWWIYLVTTAVGGSVFYDPCPSVAYRIHGRNLIGANNSRVRKAQMLLNRFKGWSDLNVRALERIESVMLAENRATFELFRRSRTQSLLPRLYGLLRCGLYRDAMLDNLGLLVAALAGKI
jgi:glycosyltransferase involved in cell wall biosynthesis